MVDDAVMEVVKCYLAGLPAFGIHARREGIIIAA